MHSFAIFALFLVQLACCSFAEETAVQEFKDGNVHFTAKLYKKIVTAKTRNLMVSPLSLEFALAFLQSGAVGKTAEEIRTALCLPSTEEKIQEAVGNLIQSMTNSTKYTFDIANKIYVRENFTIKQTFENIAKSVYQSGVESIDFTQKQKAADTINQWVANKTNDKINNLISPDSLEGAFSVIINTIYMNGNWSIQFDKNKTYNQTFFLSLENTTEIKMMHQDGKKHKYKEDLKLKAKFLQLDLVDKIASVTFVLPNSIGGLDELENQIDKVLKVDDLRWDTVDIALPTFETHTELDLDKTLKLLGIKAAFDPSLVDLSKMAGEKGDIVVSKVIQKTFVNITEGGIEAAAATAIVNTLTAVIEPQRSKVFIANHGFIYFVRVDGVIVFIGRFVGPA